MKNKEHELFEFVDEVLFFRWDPLRVSCEPSCRSEYKSYTEKIYQLLMQGQSASELGQFLHSISSDEMGTLTEKESSFEIAEYLIDYRSWILDGK